MSTKPPSFIDLPTRMKINTEQWAALMWQFACDMRVACPGIVQNFDSTRQVVTVQLAIQENILQNLAPVAVKIDQLVDVPVLLLGGNGFTICPPINTGDECLVIFGDMCIDSWFQSGGSDNVQLDRRRHDLSDGFALVGVRSQPRKLTGYSTTKLQIRSDDGNTFVEVGPNEITLKATNVTVTSPTIKLDGAVEITGDLTTDANIDGKNFLTHTHTGVTTGGGNSGPVT